MAAPSAHPSSAVDDLAERVRALRFRRRASLEYVAQAVGSTSAHLSAIETRKITNPGYKLVLALARFHGVSVSELIGEPEVLPEQIVHQAIERLRSDPQGRAALVAISRMAGDPEPRRAPRRPPLRKTRGRPSRSP